MPSPEQIREICEQLSVEHYHVGKIRPHVLRTAAASLGLSNKETIVSLATHSSDMSVIAICEDGIHGRSGSGSIYLSWRELSRLTVGFKASIWSGYTLFFSDGRNIAPLTSSELGEGLVQVIQHLQDIIEDDVQSDESPITWMLAIGSQQHGPYDAQVVQQMIAGGQVDPAATLVWRAGMDGWQPLSSVIELRPSKIRSGPPALPTAIQSDAASSQPSHFIAQSTDMGQAAESQAPEPLGSRVDVNNVPLDGLLYLPGLTLVSAQRLIDERQARLGFHAVEDVGVVLELPPHKVELLRKRVVLKPFVGSGPVTSARKRVVDF